MQIRCADYGYLLSECETSPSPRECLNCMWEECCCCWRVLSMMMMALIECVVFRWYIILVEKEDEEKTEESAGAPTPVRTTDKPTSSSITTVDPTTLDEKEESQLKEAIKKAMLDEKGQDKGYFTIGEVTSLLTMLPQTNWTESKVDRVIQEWYDKGRLMERQEIGKYSPV